MIPNFTNAIEWFLLKNDFDKCINKAFRDEMIMDIDRETEEPVEIIQRDLLNIFKNFINVKYMYFSKTGTQSLSVALKSVGVKKDDEVITTVWTGIPTISAIYQIKAKPVFVDIKSDTWNIDENKIEKKITDKTKAIVTVDLFGNPCNYDKILEIARKYNLKVIDDMCQAMTAEYHGKKLGSFCDIACVSFGSSKSFGGLGQGGAILTNDLNYCQLCDSILNHGSKLNENNCVRVGTNGYLDYMEIIYLYVKTRKFLDSNLNFRNEIADVYKQMKGFTFQKQEKNCKSAWYKIQAYTTNQDCYNLAKTLFNIDDFFSQDMCDMDFGKEYRNENKVSEQISHNSISLPMYPFINKQEVEKLVDKYNNLAKEYVR